MPQHGGKKIPKMEGCLPFVEDSFYTLAYDVFDYRVDSGKKSMTCAHSFHKCFFSAVLAWPALTEAIIPQRAMYHFCAATVDGDETEKCCKNVSSIARAFTVNIFPRKNDLVWALTFCSGAFLNEKAVEWACWPAPISPLAGHSGHFSHTNTHK